MVWIGDGKLSEGTSHRLIAKNEENEEAVQQITADLVSKKAFRNKVGIEGYPSFLKFNANLLSGLDYRDLHKWMKKLI
jgi:hypothetical protein